ncbi:reverse transcriptase protein [Rutstroemia sp. NJR-2017a WRK4]|nr:reverse transcriptase protein [Rutstroemia sp. NJR-2017a WRK4]
MIEEDGEIYADRGVIRVAVYKEQVETASESIEGLWKTNNSSPWLLYILLLRNQDGNLEDRMDRKADILKGIFFPELSEVDLADLDRY